MNTITTLNWTPTPDDYDGTNTTWGTETATTTINGHTVELIRHIDLDDDRDWQLVARIDNGDWTDHYPALCDLLGTGWAAEMADWAEDTRADLYDTEEDDLPDDAHRETFDLHDTFSEVTQRVEVVWLPEQVRVDHYGDPITVWGEGDCPARITRSAVDHAEVLTDYPEEITGDWAEVVEPHRVIHASDLDEGCYLVRRLD